MSDLLTLREAADRLHVSRTTMFNWGRVSYGPRSFRLGGRRFYRAADLAEFIETERQAEVIR